MGPMPKNRSWLRKLEDIRLENSPQYEPYEYETQNEQPFSQLTKELETMTEVGDNIAGADILLPCGDEMARGHVVVHSFDDSRNVIGPCKSYS